MAPIDYTQHLSQYDHLVKNENRLKKCNINKLHLCSPSANEEIFHIWEQNELDGNTIRDRMRKTKTAKHHSAEWSKIDQQRILKN